VRELQTARAEIAALKVSRDTALRIATWGEVRQRGPDRESDR
jgi:hypothetical protein